MVQDPLLHLFEAVVRLVQDPGRVLHLEAVRAPLAPGKVQDPVQVRANDRGLRSDRIEPSKPVQLPFGPGPGVLRKGGFLQPPLQLRPLSLFGVELLVDRLELLLEIVLLAPGLDLPGDLRVELLLDPEHFQLPTEDRPDPGELILHPVGLQEPLLLLHLGQEVSRHEVCEAHRVLELRHRVHELVVNLVVEPRELPVHSADLTDQGLGLRVPESGALDLPLAQELDVGEESAPVPPGELPDPRSPEALHDRPVGPVGKLRDLDEANHGAHPVEGRGVGLLDLGIALGHEEEEPVPAPGGLEGGDRRGPADEEGEDHVGEEDQVP